LLQQMPQPIVLGQRLVALGDRGVSFRLITSAQHRRRWTASEKVRIVEETFEPSMTVSFVARRHGVAEIAPNPQIE